MRSSINLKIAFKSIQQNKIQSSVSILGLGIGLGAVILILMLYIHEKSFDKYIPEHSQVYRVLHGTNSNLPFPLAESAKNDIPLIENYFRYHQGHAFDIRLKGEDIIREYRLACADAFVFECLGIDFIIGKNAETIDEIAISEEMAKKYFPDDNAMNKTIEVRLNDEFINLTVCGVYKNLPSSSTLSPNFIAHTDLIAEFLGTRKKQLGEYAEKSVEFKSDWERDVCITYFKFTKNADLNEVTNKLQEYRNHYNDDRKKEAPFKLQPITSVYLESNDITDSYSRRGNVNELKYFLAIAFFILIIAVFNYIFLTKAKMDRRLKEFGVKRAMGASSVSIRRQMLLEANVVSLLSVIPAIFVVIIGMPFINDTLGRNLDSQILSIWYVIPILSTIPIITGTISGLFVAYKISGVSPVLLLNRTSSNYRKKNQWSNSFLILHFTVFIILIVGVSVLKKQIDFALNNPQAINTENIIICELNTPELSQKFDVITNYVEQIPGVIHTAGSSFIPPFNWTLPIRLKNADDGSTIVFDGLIMGKGMIELLGIELIAGDSFLDYNETDRRFIFNESAAKEYKLKVGESFNGFHIQGIVKDFTAHSMRNAINPMVIIQQSPTKMRLFAIKTTGENEQEIRASVEKLFKKISPDNITSIYTLQDQINRFYVREENQTKLVWGFSLITLVLTIMGLFSMVLNTLTGKTKEIGIRRVNGAQVSEILMMLNKDFLKWVVIAFIIASPLAYYFMDSWLENFAYKTQLSWWIFALAGLTALFIALLTVSWQTLKVARRNPVEALRYE